MLRNDDPDLYQVAQDRCFGLFSPGWPKDAGKMEEMIRDWRGSNHLGDLLGAS